MVTPLDAAGLGDAVAKLARTDTDLARVVDRLGPPPLWGREPGFETLVRIILEQQVSLSSGAAAYERLRRTAGDVSPGPIRAAGEDRLREAGITRQKARYIVAMADSVLAGRLDLEAIGRVEDDEARSALVAILGVGRWTADIYLLMALARPDIWPQGDLALATAMRRVKGLKAVPTADLQASIAEPWRPWRAVAARILWHAYLAGER